jgi:hypothetical protein
MKTRIVLYLSTVPAHNFKKLEPFVGVVTNTFMSLFMATWQYFPFLTC